MDTETAPADAWIAWTSRIYTPRCVSRGSKQRFFTDRTRGLIAHVGGSPSRTQIVLIRRAVELEWLLTKLDMDGALTVHDARVYLSMHNSLRATLSKLGLDGVTGAADEPKPVPEAKPEPVPKAAAPKPVEKKSRRHRPVRTISDLMANPT